jgi:hypothetical protein
VLKAAANATVAALFPLCSHDMVGGAGVERRITVVDVCEYAEKPTAVTARSANDRRTSRGTSGTVVCEVAY